MPVYKRYQIIQQLIYLADAYKPLKVYIEVSKIAELTGRKAAHKESIVVSNKFEKKKGYKKCAKSYYNFISRVSNKLLHARKGINSATLQKNQLLKIFRVSKLPGITFFTTSLGAVNHCFNTDE